MTKDEQHELRRHISKALRKTCKLKRAKLKKSVSLMLEARLSVDDTGEEVLPLHPMMDLPPHQPQT